MRETMRLALKSRADKKDNSIFMCIHHLFRVQTQRGNAYANRSCADHQTTNVKIQRVAATHFFSVTVFHRSGAELSARAEM